MVGDDFYYIPADACIASIMLGSQSGKDTVEYIETLLENGMNRVFVFGGNTPLISEKINIIIQNKPEYANRIIRLAKQGDKEIAALMTRSNVIIIRSGGLSVMEQMVMEHNKKQIIFIHHANSIQPRLTSGITWEDCNADSLINYLSKQDIHVEKTTPDRLNNQLIKTQTVASGLKLGL